MTAGVEVRGLNELVRELRGPVFREVNAELRQHARTIATDLRPLVESAVRSSAAPQAEAMAATVRVHSDRVPVLVVGKVNPRFASGFRRRGQSAADARARRGSLARGVLHGPLGGHRGTPAAENYYRIGRDPVGPLGRALAGPILDRACDLYLRAYAATLRAHGFEVT